MNPPTAAASTGRADRATTAPEYAPYPRLSLEDVAPPPPPPYHAATAAPPPYGGNPYVSFLAGGAATAPKSASPHTPNLASFGSFLTVGGGGLVRGAFADTMDSVKDVLRKMGKRFGEAARKTENITGNFWQHCEFRFYSCSIF